jgi:hypothetical protein
MKFNIQSIPPISTLYFIQDNSVCYRDLLKKTRPTCINIDNIPDESIYQDCNWSSFLADFIQVSIGELQRVYHLAGLINKKYPFVVWKWEARLLKAEQRDRYLRYKMQYLISLGISNKSAIVTNIYRAIDFDVAYDKYSNEFETDEFLLEKTKALLKQWVSY